MDQSALTPAVIGSQACHHFKLALLDVPWSRAFFGDMAILPAVVATFVSSGFGAVGRHVPYLATIETTPVLGTCLVDCLTFIAF